MNEDCMPGSTFETRPFVDVADDAALAFAFDEDFSDEIVFEDGHHGFVAVGGDDHLLGHAPTPGYALNLVIGSFGHLVID